LASTPGAWTDVTARLTAALLSCRQGRMADAEAHLARAEEVFAVQSEALVFDSTPYARNLPWRPATPSGRTPLP
jgi:hypothetical protein